MNEYKDKVISYRKVHGLTQAEMAQKCGVTRATISNIERKERHYVNIVTRGKIDKILGE